MRYPLLAALGLSVSLSALAAPSAGAQVPTPPRTPGVVTEPRPGVPDEGPIISRIGKRPVETPTGTAVGEAIPSFSQLFGSVGRDFRNLPSRENALLLGIGAGLAGLSHGVDRELSEDWTRPGPHGPILEPGSLIGNSYLHLGAAFGLYAAGRAGGNTRLGVFGADLVRAQILAQSTTYALKFAAGRTRPNGEARSFPSGHTATVFASATVVQQHFGWKAGIPAYAAAAYVGAHRIAASKHYLSDVAFGAALGLIAGRTVTIGQRNMKFALTPVAGPGGGVGIGFTKVQP